MGFIGGEPGEVLGAFEGLQLRGHGVGAIAVGGVVETFALEVEDAGVSAEVALLFEKAEIAAVDDE